MSPFFQLPTEIRHLIYEFVLVEPPKDERRHIATCPWAARSPLCLELPPFAVQRPFLVGRPFAAEGADIPGLTCHCAKRKHLAILLVNRQIHSEGSCVLWVKNVFSFSWVDHFNQWCARIGAAQRKLLRHIAIIPNPSIEGETRSEKWYRINSSLLTNLLQCTGLRNLDLAPQRLPNDFVATLARQLPHLKRLRIASLQTLFRRGPHWKVLPNALEMRLEWSWVLALVHLEVPLDDVLDAGFSERVLDYREHSALWEKRSNAVREHPKIVNVRQERFGRYCDTHSTATLQLPDETHPVKVPMIGLPNSLDTRYRYEREREEAEKLRKRLEAREEQLRRSEAKRRARNRRSSRSQRPEGQRIS